MKDHLKEIKQAAEKIVALMSDPQPGLLTWNSALLVNINVIAAHGSKCICDGREYHLGPD